MVEEPVQLEMYDVMGRLILQKNIAALSGDDVDLDLSSLSPGVYYVSVRTKDSLVTQKLIKE
jgi:hypothetical protein